MWSAQVKIQVPVSSRSSGGSFSQNTVILFVVILEQERDRCPISALYRQRPGCMKTQQDMNFLPVVVQEEFFFLVGILMLSKSRKLRTVSILSSHLLWLERDLEEKAAPCLACSQKKRKEVRRKKKTVRLIDSHYHVYRIWKLPLLVKASITRCWIPMSPENTEMLQSDSEHCHRAPLCPNTQV